MHTSPAARTDWLAYEGPTNPGNLAILVNVVRPSPCSRSDQELGPRRRLLRNDVGLHHVAQGFLGLVLEVLVDGSSVVPREPDPEMANQGVHHPRPEVVARRRDQRGDR